MEKVKRMRCDKKKKSNKVGGGLFCVGECVCVYKHLRNEEKFLDIRVFCYCSNF